MSSSVFLSSTSFSARLSNSEFNLSARFNERQEVVQGKLGSSSIVQTRQSQTEINLVQETTQISARSDDGGDKLLEAAKAYLETLYSIGQAFGFDENDQISQLARQVVNAGAGDDIINTTGTARVRSGSGDDFINFSGQGRINSGSGDDLINASGRTRILSGSGDDVINAAGKSRINTGAGDDLVNVAGLSRIRTGSGDDFINAVGLSRINAGSGDDFIRAYGQSIIRGGAGDDIIEVGGQGALIEFGLGDGSDEIFASTDIDIKIGSQLTQDDVTITNENGKLVIGFDASDDELTIDLNSGSVATLNFSNGESLSIRSSIDIDI